MKFWRENLPVRIAAATTGLLTIVLVAISFASYLNTALLVRQGLDDSMAAALPLNASSLRELHEHEHGSPPTPPSGTPPQLTILDVDGRIRDGSGDLPVDPAALAVAVSQGRAYTTLSEQDGQYVVRRGPDWWQAITANDDDMRVMYARWGREREPLILAESAPLEEVADVLPRLLVRLLLLTAGGAMLCGVIIWLMAGRFYRPLRAVIAIADEITMETLAKRIPDKWGDRTLRHLGAVLNAMIGRLQEAFEAQGRFVAAAAHELRGPLGAMRANLEVRLRRERTPQEYREALSIALSETERLTALSEHLLILARYEHGVGMAVERALPLQPLLERVVEEVCRSAGGEAQVSVPEGLCVDGDPLALERMVANLVRNAIQAGGAPVEVSARTVDGGVQIDVRDHGCGIAPEAIPRLFEPFYRGDPARGRESGTGLGLAIVHTIVEFHGGRVQVESTEGKGTTFSVWLPAQQSA